MLRFWNLNSRTFGPRRSLQAFGGDLIYLSRVCNSFIVWFQNSEGKSTRIDSYISILYFNVQYVFHLFEFGSDTGIFLVSDPNSNKTSINMKKTAPLTPLPANTIVQSAEYWYFVIDLMVHFRQEFGIGNDRLLGYFLGAGLDDQLAERLVHLFSISTDIEEHAGQLFANLPEGQEQDVIERVIYSILEENGYHCRTPGSRAQIGRKMYESVTTHLVDGNTKLEYIQSIGNSILQRLIAS